MAPKKFQLTFEKFVENSLSTSVKKPRKTYVKIKPLLDDHESACEEFSKRCDEKDRLKRKKGVTLPGPLHPDKLSDYAEWVRVRSLRGERVKINRINIKGSGTLRNTYQNCYTIHTRIMACLQVILEVRSCFMYRFKKLYEQWMETKGEFKIDLGAPNQKWSHITPKKQCAFTNLEVEFRKMFDSTFWPGAFRGLTIHVDSIVEAKIKRQNT